MAQDIEFDDEVDAPVEPNRATDFSQAVLHSSDWTVETILSQLDKGNIQLNPNFQRRDAWSPSRKSRFIESVILGLPVPQLVFAELKSHRGRYIVLDGKQRLLALLRFAESKDDRTLGFGLSGLEIRSDLTRKRYFNFENDLALQNERDAFLNYTVRTVVIRNWPNTDFLHQVFLRLNTGSVKLSAQELRQAMAPGEFTSFADEFAAGSAAIQSLLGRDAPDPRMRDVELLVRHIGFRRHVTKYRGRLKRFLDDVCADENAGWQDDEVQVRGAAEQLNLAIVELSQIFGDSLARKPGSRSFNRAIFDALAFYAADPAIRGRMAAARDAVLAAYGRITLMQDFLDAVESDTAGVPNTLARFQMWARSLSEALEIPIAAPEQDVDGAIVFA